MTGDTPAHPEPAASLIAPIYGMNYLLDWTVRHIRSLTSDRGLIILVSKELYVDTFAFVSKSAHFSCFLNRYSFYGHGSTNMSR